MMAWQQIESRIIGMISNKYLGKHFYIHFYLVFIDPHTPEINQLIAMLFGSYFHGAAFSQPTVQPPPWAMWILTVII